MVWTDKDREECLREWEINYGRKEKPMTELRKGRIILEGDIKAKIYNWDGLNVVLHVGKGARRFLVPRSLMTNFKYVRAKKEEVHVAF